jgi:phosphotriesterase-related protein
LYVHEATVGIDGSDVKAGIIKCAHESGVTWERGSGFTKAGKVTARAAARAAVATGLPITTHTEVEEEVGLAQLDIFEEEGVDLNRVYIGHCNDRYALSHSRILSHPLSYPLTSTHVLIYTTHICSTNLDYLLRMLARGCWIGLDRTGPGKSKGPRPDWKTRATVIKAVIDAG